MRCSNCGCLLSRRFHSDYRCQRWAQIVKLYGRPEGLTLAEIGAQVGFTRERIRQVGKLAGLRTRRARKDWKWPKERCLDCGCMVVPQFHPKNECERFAQIVKLFKRREGLTLAEIGAQVGLSRLRIIQVAEMAGLDKCRILDRKYWESLRAPCPECGLIVVLKFHPKEICQRNVQIFHLYDGPEALSLRQIAKRVGLCATSVRKILKRAGLYRSRAPGRKHAGPVVGKTLQ